MKPTYLWRLGLASAIALAAPQSAQAANPTLAVSDAVVNEGNSGTINAAFQIKLSAASPLPVTVKYATANATALAGIDYNAVPLTTVVFAAGQTTKIVNVPVIGDTIDEADEAFTLKLSSPNGAAISDATGTGKIVDNDTSVVTVVGATVNEDSGTMNFALKLSAPNSRPVTVKAQTTNAPTQPATVTRDYNYLSPINLTFPTGTTTLNVPVDIFEDQLNEDNEKVGLLLSSPVNAVLGSIAPGTIVDNDAAPQLKISDVRIMEGNTGSTNATFTVSLSAPSGKTVTVQANTVNGTAVAGRDYTALPLTTVTFAPGQTTKTVNVPVTGDLIDELNEFFSLKLSNPVNATIQDSVGVANITDNDTSIVSAVGATVNEGDAGDVPMKFAVKLSNPNSQPVTVKVRTDNAPVNPGMPHADYDPLPVTVVSFAPGETSKIVNVNVKGDTLDEENEKVALLLVNPVNAVLGTSTPGTITDDDALPALKISDLTISEGNIGVKNAALTVSLSAASGRPVNVKYATANISAVAGTDYTAVPLTTLTIPAGQTSKTINVPILGDTAPEPAEQLKVVLSANQNATLADATGIITIANDDNWPAEAWDDYFEFNFNGASTFDETLDVLDNDNDMDGDPLTIVSVTQPQGSFTGSASAQIVNGKIRVICNGLNENFGSITFDYTITDGQSTSTTTVLIDFVNTLNNPPVANSDVYNDGVAYGPGASYIATINPLANDTDVDGNALKLANVYGLTGDFAPGTATVEIVNNQAVLKVTQLPATSGVITFSYDVSDGASTSSSYVDVSYNVQHGFQAKQRVRSNTSPSGRSF